MIKIIIADDHNLFREGLKMLLRKDKEFEVVAEAESGKELLEILAHQETDIVLMDISMPEMSGLETMKLAKKQFPKLRFIMITMHAEGQYVVQAVKNGAYGYLLKNSDEEELKFALKSVALGKKYFNQEISTLMANSLSEHDMGNSKLSQRELEILGLVAQGKITKEIADKLCVSTRTIETHRNNMMKKLNVQNTAELIKKATEMKLI
jgi:two-component system, NarL family, response regulator NreC